MPGLYVDLVSGTSLELQLPPSLPGWKNLEYSILCHINNYWIIERMLFTIFSQQQM
jgi:hypothetical protein